MHIIYGGLFVIIHVGFFVTKMINALRWKDLVDERMNICWMLFYKIVNHKVNVPSEGGNKHKSSTQYIYAYWFQQTQLQIFFPPTNHSGVTKTFEALLSMLQVLRPLRKGWRPCHLQGPECICAFLISAVILRTYPVSHKEGLLIINYSGSDSCLPESFLCTC